MEVSVVINTETDARVSTFYTRKGDAERAARKLNQHRPELKKYQARTYILVDKETEKSIENQDN